MGSNKEYSSHSCRHYICIAAKTAALFEESNVSDDDAN